MLSFMTRLALEKNAKALKQTMCTMETITWYMAEQPQWCLAACSTMPQINMTATS
jgi:hypothetical protein